ncbi:flagellar biosynthetic protein FlhB [Thermosyntropha lipolytica DSM 11003]|uniref:Flagellar biosynthetic protein FlhB n=1 Tax=Thermosyntropha lipolytica DSM 11003 TaxID=1123382 RepID=A0A1M5KZ56_9FIRM|nr:flagellar biosynthesis protein FlhB [Thermosyntropha lipolytica]SHG57779.1 flagellar biosynthetic protein FlhB [Thermosyntropha lipolytica DSM 11003]
MQEEKIWGFDLQLFAEGETGEKTEQPTPRRREEARKKGQVFKSNDLNSAVVLVAGTVALFIISPYMLESFKAFTAVFILEKSQEEFSFLYAYRLFVETLWVMAKMVGPVFLATFLAALLITYLQVGFVFSGEPLRPKLERLNPVEGFKRIFSKRALVELLKSVLKVLVTGYIVYTVIKKDFSLFTHMIDMELIACIKAMRSIVFEIALKVGIAFIIIGILDYLYQRYEYEKSLKMSKYDIKQEYKETEGDPLIKSRQRQIQREMAMRRMMAEVPKADVVITNPTHFAVVLKYEAEKMDAPMVVAKGQDFMALKIKEIARQNDVAVVENPPLARTLYYTVDIGQQIPEEMYQAVAEILAFVYKQKKVV